MDLCKYGPVRECLLGSMRIWLVWFGSLHTNALSPMSRHVCKFSLAGFLVSSGFRHGYVNAVSSIATRGAKYVFDASEVG